MTTKRWKYIDTVCVRRYICPRCRETLVKRWPPYGRDLDTSLLRCELCDWHEEPEPKGVSHEQG